MAERILKDPYNFDFLTVTDTAKERAIERGLLTHLRDLLLELGRDTPQNADHGRHSTRSRDILRR